MKIWRDWDLYWTIAEHYIWEDSNYVIMLSYSYVWALKETNRQYSYCIQVKMEIILYWDPLYYKICYVKKYELFSGHKTGDKLIEHLIFPNHHFILLFSSCMDQLIISKHHLCFILFMSPNKLLILKWCSHRIFQFICWYLFKYPY